MASFSVVSLAFKSMMTLRSRFSFQRSCRQHYCKVDYLMTFPNLSISYMIFSTQHSLLRKPRQSSHLESLGICLETFQKYSKSFCVCAFSLKCYWETAITMAAVEQRENSDSSQVCVHVHSKVVYVILAGMVNRQDMGQQTTINVQSQDTNYCSTNSEFDLLKPTYSICSFYKKQN